MSGSPTVLPPRLGGRTTVADSSDRRATLSRAGLRRIPVFGWWLLGGLVVVVAYFLLPLVGGSPLAQAVTYCAVSFGSAVAVVVGERLNRPRARSAWWMLAAGQVAFSAGDIAYYISSLRHHDVTYPVLANVFYLAQYPFVGIGLAILIRHRSRGWNATAYIDAAIVGTGAALLWWTFLIHPIVTAPGVSTLDRFAATAYPVMDLAVLVVALRLVLAGGGRNVSFRLLSGFLAAVLFADTAYGLQTLHGEFVNGGWLDASWLVGYLLLGAAALHPSVRALDQPGAAVTATISRYRLVLLASAVLMVPVVLVVEYLRASDGNLLVVAGACTVLFLLVLTRMSRLIAAQRQLAITDELTGLHTRRFLQERLRSEWARLRRQGGHLGFLLVDVDHFKWVNDSYGHPAGDRVLVEVARRLQDSCRSDDVVARFGGEEFAVLVPDLPADSVRGLAERIRHTITASPVRVSDDAEVTVTVSVGGATVPLDTGDGDELVRIADAALYAAKEAGRDLVVFGRSGASAPADTVPADGYDAVTPIDDDAVTDWVAAVVESLRHRQSPPIPETRVVAVCAAWAFMRTGTDGRRPLTRQQAEAQLRRGRGTQFEPAVVDAFLRLEVARVVGSHGDRAPAAQS